MEEDDNNPQQGGDGAVGVRIPFKSCGSGGVALRLGDLSSKPPHRKFPGGVLGPCGKTAGKEAPVEET